MIRASAGAKGEARWAAAENTMIPAISAARSSRRSTPSNPRGATSTTNNTGSGAPVLRERHQETEERAGERAEQSIHRRAHGPSRRNPRHDGGGNDRPEWLGEIEPRSNHIREKGREHDGEHLP